MNSNKLLEQFNILNKQVEYFKSKYSTCSDEKDKKKEENNNIFSIIIKSFNMIIDEKNNKNNHNDYKPNIGVFGENSTGKSTFLNALLGNKDEFKMGMSETTDKICVLHNGYTGKQNDNFEYRQRDYEYLKYMNIYDVPGFGKYFSEDELTQLLKSLDIVFWVVNVSSGIKKSDKKFFNQIKKNDNKVIVIFNKIDSILENSLEENPLDEINIEIEKTYKIFQDNDIEENLIGIIPLSANKILLNKIKNKKVFYLAYDAILSKLLLYAVFVESYRETYKSIKIDYNFKKWYYNKCKTIISDIKQDLRYELKEEISFLTGLNPFNSKDDEARPIVRKYIDRLNEKINNINLNIKVKKIIKGQLTTLDKFNIFSNKQIVTLPNIDSVDFNFYINLESLAWDSFWGDSFAYDVAEIFETKALKKIRKRANQIKIICDCSIEEFNEYFHKNCDTYAKTLDDKLSNFTKNMTHILLKYMLKDIEGTLTKNEIEEFENIIKLS